MNFSEQDEVDPSCFPSPNQEMRLALTRFLPDLLQGTLHQHVMQLEKLASNVESSTDSCMLGALGSKLPLFTFGNWNSVESTLPFIGPLMHWFVMYGIVQVDWRMVCAVRLLECV